MGNVYRYRRRKLPVPPAACLSKLAGYAAAGRIKGVAFVCLLDDNGYIADTCGTASEEPDAVRQLLRALEAKIASRQLRDR